MTEFFSANPSVVRSTKQRILLNSWLRALGQGKSLPAIAEFQVDGIADELDDMLGFRVEGDSAAARFVITQEGARLAATYGSEHIAPTLRTNRYLDDALGPERYARVAPCYFACVALKRPTYSISRVADADGKDVCYERLLLPFGGAERVEQIVGSYKAISVEGGFKISNLMGIAAGHHTGSRDQRVDRPRARAPPARRAHRRRYRRG